LAWNAGVPNLLGYSENEFLGKHASIIFTPPDKAFEVCEAELKLAAENGYSSDIRWHMRKDGTEFFAHNAPSAFLNACTKTNTPARA
jgi:hypothetical protein